MSFSRGNLFCSLMMLAQLINASVMAQAQQTASALPETNAPPINRVSGGTRGSTDMILVALAPVTTGLTSSLHPTLYWYSSKGQSTPLEFSLIDDQAIKPLVERKVNAPTAGLHALIIDYSLKRGVEYRWSITYRVNPNEYTNDIVASGNLKSLPLPDELAQKLKHLNQKEKLSLYTQNGFWYDAVALLFEQLDMQPTDQDLLKQREMLMVKEKIIIEGCSKNEDKCAIKDALKPENKNP